jgi:uncharacterized membrane protein YccF (DUF307 family)
MKVREGLLGRRRSNFRNNEVEAVNNVKQESFVELLNIFHILFGLFLKVIH